MSSTMDELNAVDLASFVARLGNLVEYFPVLAASLYQRRPFASREDLVASAHEIIDALPFVVKQGILGVHPDLAGRLAQQGGLTDESLKEQRSAGLNLAEMEAGKKREICNLNERYRNKFGFPFVICARLNNVDTIAEELRRRMSNGKEQETLAGIEEVKKISRLRAMDLVKVAPQVSRL